MRVPLYAFPQPAEPFDDKWLGDGDSVHVLPTTTDIGAGEQAVAWLIERENGPEYFGHIPSYIPKHERTPEYGVHPLYTHPPQPAERVVEAMDPDALASTVANIRQGESDSPRCEPPSDYDVDVARKWTARVLKAMDIRRAALAQEGRDG